MTCNVHAPPDLRAFEQEVAKMGVLLAGLDDNAIERLAQRAIDPGRQERRDL